MKSKLITKFRNFVFTGLILIGGLSAIHAAQYDANRLSALAQLRYGQQAFTDVQELNRLISTIRSAPEVERLRQVNDYFNQRISFIDDIDLWKQTDYWSTPLETIGIRAGDCEDFSIAKYIVLQLANVDNDKLRLTYVKAEMLNDGRKFNRAHMVVSYYQTPQAEPLILDNLVPEIEPASNRKDLYPIFSFNKQGIFVGNSTKPKGEAESHLSRWRDVLSRIRADGIE